MVSIDDDDESERELEACEEVGVEGSEDAMVLDEVASSRRFHLERDEPSFSSFTSSVRSPSPTPEPSPPPSRAATPVPGK